MKGGGSVNSLTPHGVRQIMETNLNDRVDIIVQIYKIKSFEPKTQRIKMRYFKLKQIQPERWELVRNRYYFQRSAD